MEYKQRIYKFAPPSFSSQNFKQYIYLLTQQFHLDGAKASQDKDITRTNASIFTLKPCLLVLYVSQWYYIHLAK